MGRQLCTKQSFQNVRANAWTDERAVRRETRERRKYMEANCHGTVGWLIHGRYPDLLRGVQILGMPRVYGNHGNSKPGSASSALKLARRRGGVSQEVKGSDGRGQTGLEESDLSSFKTCMWWRRHTEVTRLLVVVFFIHQIPKEI